MMQMRQARVRPLVAVDFTALSNGALPSPFLGATFAIASGVVTNNPSVGAELLPNPGLTGSYTAGLAPSLFKTGSPTIAESSDGHGDSQAQQAVAVAQLNKLGYTPNTTPVAGAWYRYSGWGKAASAGSTTERMQSEHAALIPQGTTSAMVINTTTYTKKQTSFITNTTAALVSTIFFETNTSGFVQCIVDDFSLKRLTFADLFALLPATQADVSVKVTPDTIADSTLSGIIARADAQSSPTSCLLAFWRRNAVETQLNFSLVEFSGGTYTNKINETSVSQVAGAQLELRLSGTTAQMFYNNAQVGTNQTVSVSGAYHGMCITGGNNIRRFSLARAA